MEVGDALPFTVEQCASFRFMVHAIQNVHEALKLVLHVAMLVLMPSQILNLYLR